MKETIIAFFVALCIGAAINSFGQLSTAPSAQTPSGSQNESGGTTTGGSAETTAPASGLVVESTDGSFANDVLKSDKPVLVDFYADWCGPCRKMAPVLEKLATQYDGAIKFVRVNSDRCPDTCKQYRITALPTFVIFNQGKQGESFVGLVPQELLATALNKVGSGSSELAQ